MKYSKSAPEILIKLYEHLTNTRNKNNNQNQDEEDEAVAQSIKYLSSKSVPHIEIEGSTVVYWAKKDLPDNTCIQKLGNLISDTKEMPKVWSTISKYSIAINNGIENKNDYLLFWRACHDGILEYRERVRLAKSVPNSKKIRLSKTDHKKQYQEIHDLALQLTEKMEQSDFFNNRANIQPRDLFWGGGVEEMLSYVKATHHTEEDKKRCEEDFMHLLVHHMFGYKELLINIAGKANKLKNINPLVLKANSQNAYIQHFVITLSKFLRNKYGEPLHKTVAATASVIFVDDSISENWVAKLVKDKQGNVELQV